MSSQDYSWFAQWFAALIGNVETIVKGKRDEIGLVFLALFAKGHVLLEDNPGTGKTTLAKAIAASIDGQWNRVQFTPDLLPSDITGGTILNQKDGTFTFRQGPIFANVVLGDEINRASPKTQSALLQVMEEAEVTVDGVTHGVPQPFIVLATQNPIEQSGTYQLPEAQLDRFIIKLGLGYPAHDAEVDMLRTIGAGHGVQRVKPIVRTDQVAQMIVAVRAIHLEDSIRSYIVRLCRHTRESLPEVDLGVSPRGAIALMAMGQAMAASQGRGYVNVDDIRRVAPYVMGHRLLLTPMAELEKVSTEALVAQTIDHVPAPEPARR